MIGFDISPARVRLPDGTTIAKARAWSRDGRVRIFTAVGRRAVLALEGTATEIVRSIKPRFDPHVVTLDDARVVQVWQASGCGSCGNPLSRIDPATWTP